jgi:type IX secretion system PorP/SprF family membrane protein
MKTSMRFPIPAIALVCLLSGSLEAQSTFRYDQYFNDPSIVNLAAINTQQRSSLSLFYNRMYAAVPGSPENLALNLSLPVAGKGIGFAVQFAQEKVGFSQLQTWNVGYAYTAKLSGKARLHFAAGLGLLNQRFDLLNAIYTDPDDPLIDALQLGTRSNRIDLRGALLYQHGNFMAGMAGSRLVNPRFDYNYFRYRADYNLQTVTNFMARHSIPLSGDGRIVLMPSMVASLYDFDYLRLQANASLMIDETVWAGVTYTDNRLGGFNLGVNLYNSIRLGYAFATPLARLNTQLGASHELFTSFSFGNAGEVREREVAKVDPVEVKPTPPAPPVIPETPVGPVKPAPVPPRNRDTAIAKPTPVPAKPPAAAPAPPATKPGTATEGWPRPGYYVVVGTFSSSENADRRIKELLAKGIASKRMYYPPNKYYYVYIRYTLNQEEADRIKLEGVPGIDDIWVRTVQAPK